MTTAAAPTWQSWDASLNTPGPWHGPRVDRPDGGKDVPWPIGTHLADLCYLPGGEPPPTDAVVIVTEGEKAADAVAAAGRYAIGTVGGASSTPGPAVITLIARYRPILSPDNDPQGRGHMSRIAAALERVGLTDLHWIDPPADAPKGWDLADVEPDERRTLIDGARSLTGFGLGPETADDTADEPAVSGDVIDLAIRGEDRRKKQRERSQASRMAAKAWELADLFHDDERVGYATIPIGDHRETWPIRSMSFRHWITQCLFEEELAAGATLADVSAPSGQAVRDAMGMCEALAIHRGSMNPVYRRIAGLDDGWIVLDLANDSWEAVTISAAGWTVTDEPPVRFLRADGVLPLPYPERDGSIDELRPFLNIQSEDAWRLTVAWLIMAFRPRGPYPVLALSGEQGAAKSTAGRFIRGLVDPNKVADRTMPRDERDLAISARNQWVTNLDNLSRLPDWLSDGLARLSTGAGLSTRQLYTDTDEIRFYAMRPTLINGIADVITRGDLLDRAILVELAAVPPSGRRVETEIRAEYEAARPRILGAILDAVAQALANERNITLKHYPRMADFAKWVTAAEPALGWTPGSFLDAYRANRASVHEIALDISPVAIALRDFITSGTVWEGTASELLEALTNQVSDDVARRKTWPESPKGLSDDLRRLVPNLRAIGITVAFKRGARRRSIAISQGPTTGRSASSASSASSELDPASPNVPAVTDGDASDAPFQTLVGSDGETPSRAGRVAVVVPAGDAASGGDGAPDPGPPGPLRICPSCKRLHRAGMTCTGAVW